MVYVQLSMARHRLTKRMNETVQSRHVIKCPSCVFPVIWMPNFAASVSRTYQGESAAGDTRYVTRRSGRGRSGTAP